MYSITNAMLVRVFKSLHFVSPVAKKLSLVHANLKRSFLYKIRSSLKIFGYAFSVKATAFEVFTKPSKPDL